MLGCFGRMLTPTSCGDLGGRSNRYREDEGEAATATVRRLRIAAASSLVVLFVIGGAAALWLTMRASEPSPARSSAERTLPPPERLDTLPNARSSERRSTKSRRAPRDPMRPPASQGTRAPPPALR